MESRKLIFHLATYVLVVAAFLVSLGFASRKQAIMPCTGLVVKVNETSETGFVDESDIRQIVQNKFGSLEGTPVSSINISLLEKIVNTNPFIYDAEVFSTIDGKLNIEVKQRIPVLRVINYNNESFYVDRDGQFMPLSDKYTARVPVASGYLFDKESGVRLRRFDKGQINDTSIVKTKIEHLFHIISYTDTSEFWKSVVQQLYVNVNGEIELIPRIGNHTVILGDAVSLDEKLDKLFVFYKEGISKKGWGKYQTVNLKYKNQVVCTKK
jgi:cell division protein FtsQ